MTERNAISSSSLKSENVVYVYRMTEQEVHSHLLDLGQVYYVAAI